MLEFREFKTLVKSLPVGKSLPDALYIHESALDTLPKKLGKHIAKAIIGLELEDKDWNLIKFFKRDHKITLLNYPTFFDTAYPELHTSYTIDLEKLTVRKANYNQSDNPPILHRKETFLKEDHPSVPEFKAITKECEKAGLFENVRTIGFKNSWHLLINRKGYKLDENGRLVPLSDALPSNDEIENKNKYIERYRTAINRHKLSTPMQALAKHNYLNGQYSILDYGCGRGDDLRELENHKVPCIGWDPVHRPDIAKSSMDIVNLGFVINVIEDRKERDKTLRDAYTLAKKHLCIAVMPFNASIISRFKPYKDGVITKHNTFQKYYTQAEIRNYLETTLNESVIALAPGIFFIFKDKDEQLFLVNRERITHEWKFLSNKTRKVKQIPAKRIIEKHQALFEDFWHTCLSLGRMPANHEFEFSDEIRRVRSSHNKALKALLEVYGEEDFNLARKARREDLLVYFALGLFSKRKPYTHMPDSLRLDIKAHFNSYNEAIEEAKELLFALGNTETIDKSCRQIHEMLKGGYYREGESFTMHASAQKYFDPILRIYVGCGKILYGEFDSIDLIKIHIKSGKLSLMQYDDFNEKPLPELKQRIKINFRTSDCDIFVYGNKNTMQLLYLKSVFCYPEYPNYKKQQKFDAKLSSLKLFNFSRYGPTKKEFYTTLEQNRIDIKNFNIKLKS